MGTISQNNFQRYGCLFLSIVVLTSGMSGCVKNSATASSVESEQTGQLKENTKNASDKNLVENFTTEGKPTKEIETPWGPQEIYDPVQDEVVKSAFKKVYDKKYTSTNYRNREYRQKLADSDLLIIYLAKEIHNTDVLRLGCKGIETFEAGQSYGYYDTLETLTRPCNYKANLGKPVTICEERVFQHFVRSSPSHGFLNGKLRPSQVLYPIGYNIDFEDEFVKKSIKPLVKDLTWKDELADFFDYECGKWRKQK